MGKITPKMKLYKEFLANPAKVSPAITTFMKENPMTSI